MFCKIFHIDKESTSESISKYLELEKNCNIITDDINIKNDLEKIGNSCKTLSEIFPDVDPTSSKIYDLTVNKIQEYKDRLSTVNYIDIPIFTLLEPILRDDLLLINKFNFLLNEKQNLVIIFRNLTHSLFLLNKLAREEGFETFHKSKINNINRNKINLISSIKEKVSFKKKLYLTLKKDSKIDILTSIKEKTEFLNKQQKLTLFFLTPSTRYVLNPIFSVVDKFNQKNASNHMISFDRSLIDELKKDNFSISDFSRESLLLSNVIQNNDDGKKLSENILKIAKEYKLESIIFDDFINAKIYNIFRYISIFEISKTILENTDTRSLVVAFDGNSMGNAIILSSKINNIPSYSICSLGIIKNPLTKFIYTADNILIYGTHGKNYLINFGYDPNSIKITGNVMYDYFSEINNDKCRDQINKRFQIDPLKPLIVIGQRWYADDHIWMSNFITFCNKHDFNIIIKPHPLYLTTNTPLHQLMIKKIQKSCPKMSYHIEIDIDPSILLPAADLVITDESQLGVEAALMGKPLITKNFVKNNESFLSETYEHLSDTIHITSYEDLEEKTKEILIEGKYYDQIQNSQQKLQDKFNFKINSKASEEIFSIIYNT
jgi:hypothetical protein